MEQEEYEKRIGYIKNLFEYYSTIYIQYLDAGNAKAAKETMKQIDAVLDMYLDLIKQRK